MTIKLKSIFRTSDRIEMNDGLHMTLIDHPDAPSLVKYLNDIEFYKNTCSIPHPYALNDAKAFITSVLAFEKKNGVQRDWAIRSPDGEQIGGIGLLYSHGLKSHRSEMGYWLAKSFWNRGIMTSAVQSFTRHIFDITNLVRLEALVFKGNEASCRVLEKAGFVKEGYLRKAYLKDGNYIDASLYSVIK